MISRYTRPEMARLWTDEHRPGIWLEIEVSVCEALAKRGVITADAVREMRAQAQVDVGLAAQPRQRRLQLVEQGGTDLARPDPRPRDGLRRQRRVFHGSQIDKPGAIAIAADQWRGNGQGQARFSAAARAGQRQQPCGV